MEAPAEVDLPRKSAAPACPDVRADGTLYGGISNSFFERSRQIGCLRFRNMADHQIAASPRDHQASDSAPRRSERTGASGDWLLMMQSSTGAP
jgi:hypothetical protein